MNDRVRKLAEQFWGMAGQSTCFPRDLESAILLSLPLAVVKLPRLRVSGIQEWLTKQRLPSLMPPPDRDLRACILAARGRGIIFVDGGDDPNEQRMSLAHELAHFLLDYLYPREQALRVFGEKILPVLDGDRHPTDAERFSAVLKGISFGVYSRLWIRGPAGRTPDARTLAREDLADELAIELLAPYREVVLRMRKTGRGPAAVTALLGNEFGLPSEISTTYARVLCVVGRRRPSVKEWLGLSEK